MPLLPGSRLGPYEIVAPLGSGGMGDVYHGRDPRLGRDVAIKVLRASYSTDPDRLRRFEQEARAAGMLNHPNVLAIYDVGTQDGSPYLVSELLEGMTLRELLADGPLPLRKAVDYAIQIASGIDAAHRKGIVHRDLKPENLFITRDGRVEILDFGLAKLLEPELVTGEFAAFPAPVTHTQSGVLLGTIAYMAPEQVRGEAVDPRTDIFALGAVLYEMLTGTRAFDGPSAVDVMTAILKEEPPALLDHIPGAPPVLEPILRRCLEKRPDDRFYSAHDLALALEAVPTASHSSAVAAALRRRARPWRSRTALLALLLLAAAAALTAVPALRRAVGATMLPAETSLSFQRLTFQRGWISAARFSPESRSALYSATWEGRRPEVFLVRPESSESRSLGIPDADLLSVSRDGELAIRLAPAVGLNIYHRAGTLATVPFGGGTPREVLESVRFADWGPDGRQLAVIRDLGDRRRLEYPPGNPLYETPNTTNNTIVSPRISPSGEHVAFFEGVGARVTRWSVNIVDRAGRRTVLSGGWHDWLSLAWSPRGDEIWFAASEAGSASAVYAVDLTGRQRVVSRVPGTVEMHDIAPGGDVLLSLMTYRTFSRAAITGRTAETELSWLDGSAAVALSRDGSTLLLDEHGEGGGATNVVYVRRTDGSPAVRLGSGRALALSPDGEWVLATLPGPPARLLLIPTRAGETKTVSTGHFDFIRAASWSPDGNRLVLSAAEPGHGVRLYVQSLDGPPQAITSEGFDIAGEAISPDGERIVAVGPGGDVVVLPLSGENAQPVPGTACGDVPAAWTGDGRGVYVFRRGELPAQLVRVDIASGRREPGRTFMPPDAAGVGSITSILVTPDGATAVYSYEQTLSELYLVEGLR